MSPARRRVSDRKYRDWQAAQTLVTLAAYGPRLRLPPNSAEDAVLPTVPFPGLLEVPLGG